MDLKHELQDVEDVRRYLGGGADALNWLVILDDLEDGEDVGSYAEYVELLVIQPRKQRVWLGEIAVGSVEDARWLAAQAAATLPHIAAREAGALKIASAPFGYFERTARRSA